MKKAGTDIMTPWVKPVAVDNTERCQRFRDLMEAIYGKEEVDETPIAVLVARHRDLASQYLGKRNRKSRFDPFLKKAKAAPSN